MRVLLAVDGSDCGRAAARQLGGFPLPTDSRVLVVSAAPALREVSDLRSTAALKRHLEEMAAAAAADARRLLEGRFASVETRVMEGDARAAVLAAAREWKADLIVIGARGLGAVTAFLLGSVSLGVTRNAHCPVLVVKGEPVEVRNVVVAVDGSDNAFAAVRFVAGLPLATGTTLRLVAVVETPPLAVTSPDMLDGALGSSLAALSNEARTDLERALKRAAELLRGTGATIETAILDGRVASALVQQCAASRADLIVVGARGVGSFERVVLGSVSDGVLRSAVCSVLIVRGGP